MKEVKLSSFVYSVIIYIEKPLESTNILINKYNKSQDTDNLLRIYTSDKHLKSKIIKL